MTVTLTVGTSGRNYSTWQSAINAIPANISSSGSNTPYILAGYNDSEFYSTTSSNFLNITGITTDSTNTITLTAASGQSFMDNANAQTNAFSYNVSNGVGIRLNAGYCHLLECINVPNVLITRLQMSCTTYGGGFYCVETDNNTYISNNIIEYSNALGAAAVHPGSLSTMVNCLVIVLSAASRGVTASYDTFGIYNSTIVSPSDVSNTAYGVAGSSQTWYIHNTAVFGFGTNFYTGSGTYSGCEYNCSDQSISFGSNNQASKTYANQFVGVTTSTRDYRLKSGADCVDNGFTDSSNVPGPAGTTNISGSVDAVNTSRPQGSAWDIGAWELKSSSQSYSYTASGGVVFAGTSVRVATQLHTGSGGVALGGAAAKAIGKAYATSGGVAFAGLAALLRSTARVPVGGIVMAGHAAYSNSGSVSYTAYWNPRFKPKLWKSNQSWKRF